MASEATKMAVIDNMHIHVRVFEVTELNYEVKSDLRDYIIVARSSLGPLPSCSFFTALENENASCSGTDYFWSRCMFVFNIIVLSSI